MSKGFKRTDITMLEEYSYVVSRGYEPLIDTRFSLDIFLRIEIQQKKFKSDITFYKCMWEQKPHICEETGVHLRIYSSTYISHILSRGAHPEKRFDPRNINILCLNAHNQWETGDRKSMRIYAKNQEVIETLNEEYSKYWKSR